MSREGLVRADRIWKGFHSDRTRALLRDRIELVRARLDNKVERGWRWALHDVGLIAEPGESVGLVGTNGSGKTTLLRILTRVMYPDAGTVEVVGRVGALIDVRAGIHPDLTGRENIYLYGSLMGLSRRDVTARFDEIVEFAELAGAIDRQVKFYSSGMQVRLGFSVVAHLEPDVLLVDEVLAVGDASFQQRCLDRMRKTLADGTTLVFVSHDLAAVESVCERAIWLHDGVAKAEGPVRDVLASYRAAIQNVALLSPNGQGPMHVVTAGVAGAPGDTPRSQAPLRVDMTVVSNVERAAGIYLGVSQGTAAPIFLVQRPVHFAIGPTELSCQIFICLWRKGATTCGSVCSMSVVESSCPGNPRRISMSSALVWIRLPSGFSDWRRSRSQLNGTYPNLRRKSGTLVTIRVAVTGHELFADRTARQLRDVGVVATRLGPTRLGAYRTLLSADVVLAIGGGARLRPHQRMLVRCGIPIVRLWVGTDVLRWTAGSDRDIVRHVWNSAVAPWLVDELAAKGLPDVDVIPLPCSNIPEQVPHLPKVFTILAYAPEVRKDLYGIDFISELARRFVDVRFELLATTSSEGLPPNVTPRGWVEDMDAVFRKTSLLIRPAAHDGLSNMVLESLAYGRYALWTHSLPGVERITSIEAAERYIADLVKRHSNGDLGLNVEGRSMVQERYGARAVTAALKERLEEAASSRWKRRPGPLARSVAGGLLWMMRGCLFVRPELRSRRA